MYSIKKLLSKNESIFLFESLSRIWGVQPWLGVVDLDGCLLVHYPDPEKQSKVKKFPGLQDSFRQKTYLESKGYIYSPLIISDSSIGCLISKNNGSKKSLRTLIELLNTLLIKQIINRLEKKEILRETLDTYKEINLLYSISDNTSSCLDVKQLARTILLESSKIIKTENSSLMLLNKETGQLEIKSAIGDKNNNRVQLKLGRGIAGIVAKEAKYIIANDVSQERRFIPGEKKIHSLLSVPLKTKRRVLGVINVSNKLDGEIFTARDAKLLYAMASHAASFIENAILYENKLNEDLLRKNMERYLSPHITKSLIESSRELELGGVRKKVAILFADIRNFTTLSEAMEPEAVVKFLNDYFTHMVDIIFKYGGTVDKFVGDEIMAIFGAPISRPDDEIRAIKTAIEMQRQVEWLQYCRHEWNTQLFSIGIGINSGDVIAGNIGSKKHMDYTVIGDVVNTAKRLETKAEGGKILVSRNIHYVTKDLYKFKGFGEIFVKGKKKPVEIFEVIG
jgi:adenylate cyclase